ncbi:MAG: hypothetical protein RL757_2033 [Bacteroidota bacterium]
MKKLLCMLSFICFCSSVFAQTALLKTEKLLGLVKESDLKVAPYDTWYVKNMNDYHPNPAVMLDFKGISFKNWRVKIFFGTWCGDTKREMPRFMKVLHEIGFPIENVKLIAVDDDEKYQKQSPTHEERGMSIYRVPTFIFYEKDVEMARITETPAESMERDVLKILKKQPYSSNYAAYATLDKWLKSGILLDENMSVSGLMRQIKPLIATEGELNSAGYVLMAQDKTKEALQLFKINVNIFPNSANCYDSLAEAFLKTGDKAKALTYYERALSLNPTSKTLQETVEKLKIQ